MTPTDLMNRMANHQDPEVREFSQQFKIVVRSLYQLKTCSHVGDGNPHYHYKVTNTHRTLTPCSCLTAASELLTKWMLTLQD